MRSTGLDRNHCRCAATKGIGGMKEDINKCKELIKEINISKYNQQEYAAIVDDIFSAIPIAASFETQIDNLIWKLESTQSEVGMWKDRLTHAEDLLEKIARGRLNE